MCLGSFCAIFLAAFLLHSSGYAGGERAPVTGDEPPADTSATADDHTDAKEELTASDLARLQVNELGDIMIIMYHDIRDDEGEWVRSRSNFRRDLERFNSLGYSLVPLSAYLSGDIRVPAGRAPLVLTFDDGTRGQFSMVQGDTGMIPDPGCAVGILLQFSQEHPEFGQAATFFINSGNPFGDSSHIKENLTFLIENGMEVGNHTRGHKNLAYSSPEEVAKEIGSLANEVREITGNEVVSLALPFGGYPKSEEYLLAGTWAGHEYINKGILLVGAEPAPSPFSKEFNPLAIPRIRGSQEELDKWLRQFEKYPDGRFVSDGQSETVTVREGKDADLDLGRVGGLTVRTYPSGPASTPVPS
ncbi:MAG: polysaccharide deacetylase family protein [Bacillota bacterium]